METLLVTFIVAFTQSIFLNYIGYSKLTEILFNSLLAITRGNKHLLLARDLQQLKEEQSTISAIDDFAKWAKINRQITVKQDEFDRKYSEFAIRKTKFDLIVKFGLILLNILSLWYFLRKATMPEHLKLCNFGSDPYERFILSAVFGNDQLSVIWWFMLCSFSLSIL